MILKRLQGKVLNFFCTTGFILFFIVRLYGQDQRTSISYIKPEIGGVGQLLQPTRPTIQQPNQMMRMLPVRNDYLDDQISSFTMLQVSHRLGQVFSLMPNNDAVIQLASWNKKLMYDQQNEKNVPWHYSTYFLNEEIKVEFVPGIKTGIFRITFPKKGNKNILLGSYTKDSCSWGFSGNTVTAMQYYKADEGHHNIPVYLFGRFNLNGQYGILKKGVLSHATNVTQGTDLKAAANFNNASDSVVELKYAVSFISPEQAKKNFDNELGDSSTFDLMVFQARNSWQSLFDKIKITGGTEAQKTSFYTALYRSFERMVNITEDGHYYSGYDNKIHKDDRDFYVDDWVWDTYHALHPLRMIITPKMEEDMLQSYVRMYEQSEWMPTFPVLFGDHACMNGFHSSIVFLDAYRKGLNNFDVSKAYEGMKKNAQKATMLPWRNGAKTELDEVYLKKGYFPALPPNEKDPVLAVHPFEKRQAVAITLGGSYDDWSVGQLAGELNRKEDADFFAKRSRNYENLWHPEKQFFLPKDAAGRWIDIDPKFDGGKGGREYYDENNGWTYLWQVQHDIPGLMKLMGGKLKFEQRLDQLFRENLGRSKYEFWNKFPDATGLVGQFSMGNEPSFFIPYLYNYTASPWKAQNRIRLLLDTWFDDNIFGIPGDEDGGGMSAFVVFSAMGFYPVTPGLPEYAIGSPLFDRITITLPNQKQFSIIAHNNSTANKYVQSAKINGKTLLTPFFKHADIVNGGILELEMGERPNKNWGNNAN